MAIYMLKEIVNFATKWPCPDWFHVPMSTDVSAINTAIVAVAGSSNLRNALKWANTWRYNQNISISSTSGSYSWCANANSTTWFYCYYWELWSQSLYTMGQWYGMPIRPIRNTPKKPTSSWTMLYWTSIAAGGVFRNKSEWLISVSSDWNTRYTIADKNIWAANTSSGWYYYQHGNCYWFSWAWWSSTSTKQSTTWYWPWNYYTSSTWVKQNPWASTNNNNLRWGASWNVPV